MSKIDELNLKIEYLDIDQIRPYENNPRKNDTAVKPLMESIRKFGFSYPITIDADGVIISGHTRYKAAKKLKLKTVPCVRRDDLTAEQENALRLVDNQLSSLSEWDFGKREEEFLKCGEIDLSCLGFNLGADNYIDDLLDNAFAPQAKDTDEFEMTLLFPKTRKNDVDAYLSQNGKNGLVSAILDKIIAGGGH